MKIPYFCCIGAELKRYAKDFDFMNQVYLYKVPTDDSIEEVLAEDYFKAISDSVLQDDLVYIYEASADTLHSCKFDKQNGHITAVPLASDETLTGAVTTIIHDNLTKNRAVISNNDGKVAVSEVTTTELGYLSGATSNIQNQLNEKAKTDLSNLTSAGKNIGNWSSNVSNCITEIPQDVKLELNNGTLTVKSGSRVFVPNGFEQDGTTKKFDEFVLAQNYSFAPSSVADGVYMVFISSNGSTIDYGQNPGSGSTNPSDSSIFYNTTDNKVYALLDGTVTGTRTFPIVKVTVSNNAVTSIDQVFNGFGYIGSTVFALPGVKGLYPDGRNADGTLKSGAINIGVVQTYTVSNTAVKAIRITSYGLFGYQGYIVSDTKPSVNFNMWYNPSENIMYDTGSGTPSKMNASIAGFVNYNGTRITSFAPKTTFHIVDYNDTEYIAHQAMPSNRYVGLTLGASGNTYTMPADGFLWLRKQATAVGQYMLLLNTTSGLSKTQKSASSGGYLADYIAVSKGDIVKIEYDLGSDAQFKFFYANGSK